MGFETNWNTRLPLKGKFREIYWHLFPESNPPGPLTNRLKRLCKQFCFRGDIHEISDSDLIDIAELQSCRKKHFLLPNTSKKPRSMCFISIFIGKLVSDSVLYVTAQSQKMAFSENPELVPVELRLNSFWTL